MRVAQEIDLILKEGIVSSPKDVDTGVIMGAGWPFFMGGITPYLDQMGYSARPAAGNSIPSGSSSRSKDSPVM